MSRKTLEGKIRTRLQRSKREVFMRKDFEDLGGYNQVGRVLRKLVVMEQLVKVGYGLYAKAEPGILDGKPVPRINIKELAKEALGRFGVTTTLSQAERDYNSGKSTQVPTGRCIGITGKRTRRTFQVPQGKITLEWMADDANTLEGTMETWGFQNRQA